jgi:flavin reductase (DIM6/NTAB) family NADH-FMN oxidoreductase RutF
MKTFPLNRAFQFLEPGPTILLSTSFKGKPNLMTLSWSTVIDFTPIFGCILSPGDYSFEILKKTKECVIAIPTVDLLTTVVDIGNCSGIDTDKYAQFKLTAIKAKYVKAPLVKECLTNIECKVTDTSLSGKYGLFIMEGLKAWFDSSRKEKRTIHANGDGTFKIDGRTRDLRSRMTKWQSII